MIAKMVRAPILREKKYKPGINSRQLPENRKISVDIVMIYSFIITGIGIIISYYRCRINVTDKLSRFKVLMLNIIVFVANRVKISVPNQS